MYQEKPVLFLLLFACAPETQRLPTIAPAEQTARPSPRWFWLHDLDGDGYNRLQGDCAPFDANIHPDAEESLEPNGIDENCNGEVDEATGIFLEFHITFPRSSAWIVTNTQAYTDTEDIGAWWNEEMETYFEAEDEGSTFITYQRDEWPDDYAGIRFNYEANDGYNPSFWFCQQVEDEYRVVDIQIDAWYDGTWYNQDDIEIWEAPEGGCSALIRFNE